MCVLVAVLAVIALALIGCDSKTSFVPVSDPNAIAARFVGNNSETCGSCHSEIATEYATQAHGQDFHTAHAPDDLITGRSGACAACHTIGFGEGGYTGPSTPQFEQIGCEECHGPASKHVADPSTTNISRVPDAKNTCWDCHAPSYKFVKTNPPAKTDADFYNTKPGSVAAHHPQAPFLAGVAGYMRNNEPDAHAFIDNTCVTCHQKPASGGMNHGGETLAPDMAACVSCHANGAALKTELQEEIKEKLILIGGADAIDPEEPDETGSGGLLGAFATANSINLTVNAAPDNPAVKAFKGARYNWDFVLADKSEGVHNPGFAERLLDDAIALLGGAD